MVSIKAIRQGLANMIGGTSFVSPTPESWVSMNLRTSDLARGRFTPKDGQAYIAYLRGWVDMCAKKNASTCNEAKLCQFRRGGKGSKIGKWRAKKMRGVKNVSPELTEVESSTFLSMLARPSTMENGIDFKYMRFYAKEACGNAFVYLSDDGEMMTLRPQFIAPILVDADPYIAGWVYGRGREREVAIPRENVWQFKHGPNIDSPWLGDGPTKVCNEYADLLIFGTVAEAARWRNGNPPPYAVMMPETITNPTQRDQAVKEIERQLNGPENAGNRLVLSAAEIKPLGFAPKEMEYIGGQKVSSHMVCAAFDVPENLIWPNESSLAAADVALQMYYKTGIWPRLQRDGEELTLLGQSLGLLGENEFVAYENPCDEDNESEAKYWVSLTNAGIATLNQAAEDMGLDLLPPGIGDVARFNGQIVMDQAAMDAKAEADKVAKEQALKIGANAPPDKATKSLDSVSGKDGDASRIKAIAEFAALDERDAADLERQKKEEEKTRDALILWFLSLLATAEEDSTVTVIPGTVPSAPVTPNAPTNLPAPISAPGSPVVVTPNPVPGTVPVATPVLPPSPSTVPSAPVVSPSPVAPATTPPMGVHVEYAVPPAKVAQLDKIIETGQKEAIKANIADDAEQTGLKPISPAEPIKIADARRQTMIEKITNTTQTDIRAAISDGIREGKTVQEVAEDLKAAGYPKQRAELIAANEIAYASEVAAEEFAKAHGLDFKTLYLGPVPCKLCIADKADENARGGSTPINAPYLNGQTIPPFHVRCYCTLVYHNRAPSGGV